MTQVTDEMVRAAVQTARRYARDVMGVACEVDDHTMHAALDAALAVRKPIDADIGEIIATLRSWAAALDIPSGPFANEDISAAANLIERQAEEIAELKAELIPSRELIDTLRAERAELIEALTRILSNQPIKNVCGWYPEMSSARALLERLGAVIRD